RTFVGIWFALMRVRSSSRLRSLANSSGQEPAAALRRERVVEENTVCYRSANRPGRCSVFILLMMATLLCASGTARAQASGGSITGLVSDSTGADCPLHPLAH